MRSNFQFTVFEVDEFVGRVALEKCPLCTHCLSKHGDVLVEVRTDDSDETIDVESFIDQDGFLHDADGFISGNTAVGVRCAGCHNELSDMEDVDVDELTPA